MIRLPPPPPPYSSPPLLLHPPKGPKCRRCTERYCARAHTRVALPNERLGSPDGLNALLAPRLSFLSSCRSIYGRPRWRFRRQKNTGEENRDYIAAKLPFAAAAAAAGSTTDEVDRTIVDRPARRLSCLWACQEIDEPHARWVVDVMRCDVAAGKCGLQRNARGP